MLSKNINMNDWVPDLLIGSVLIYVSLIIIKQKEYKILAAFILFLLFLGKISFNIDKQTKHITFSEWFNGKSLSLSSIMIGFLYGLLFGIMDNFGLLFGLDAFDTKFEKLPFGNSLIMKSGYGNTLSNTLSAFSGTFISKIVSNLTNTTNTPMWSDALGTFVGSLLGMYIPKMLFNIKF